MNWSYCWATGNVKNSVVGNQRETLETLQEHVLQKFGLKTFSFCLRTQKHWICLKGGRWAAFLWLLRVRQSMWLSGLCWRETRRRVYDGLLQDWRHMAVAVVAMVEFKTDGCKAEDTWHSVMEAPIQYSTNISDKYQCESLWTTKYISHLAARPGCSHHWY